MDAAQRVAEAGFPHAAACLDGTPRGARNARREMARFEPCSMGEGLAKERALKAIPQVIEQDDGTLEFL